MEEIKIYDIALRDCTCGVCRGRTASKDQYVCDKCFKLIKESPLLSRDYDDILIELRRIFYLVDGCDYDELSDELSINYLAMLEMFGGDKRGCSDIFEMCYVYLIHKSVGDFDPSNKIFKDPFEYFGGLFFYDEAEKAYEKFYLEDLEQAEDNIIELLDVLNSNSKYNIPIILFIMSCCIGINVDIDSIEDELDVFISYLIDIDE